MTPLGTSSSHGLRSKFGPFRVESDHPRAPSILSPGRCRQLRMRRASPPPETVRDPSHALGSVSVIPKRIRNESTESSDVTACEPAERGVYSVTSNTPATMATTDKMGTKVFARMALECNYTSRTIGRDIVKGLAGGQLPKVQ